MADKRLRVTTADETAPPSKIADALDMPARDLLATMRRALAKKLDDNEIAGNSIASAYRELREIDGLIRAADAAAEEEARRASSSSAARTFNSAAI